MPAIGYVTKTENGYKGQLKTLTIKTDVEFVPNTNKSKERAPDFSIYAGDRIEIGAAWNKTSQAGNPYVSLTLSAPEFGKLCANLGRAAGQDDEDVFAIILERRSRLTPQGLASRPATVTAQRKWQGSPTPGQRGEARSPC